MTIYISSEDKIYETKVSGSLEEIICYPNNLLFLYFSNGVYQVWDILHNKFIIDGLIEKDLKHIRFFNKYEIAYYAFSKQELRIFNIFDKKEKKISAKVPTKQAIPENERTDQALKTLYEEGTEFKTLCLSALLVLFEQRNNIINSNDNIITIFDDNSNPFFYQTVYANTTQKKLNLSLVNNRDTIVVWGDNFCDQPLEFYLLNVLKKDAGFKVVTMHNLNLNCQLINAMGWDTNEILLIGNYNSGLSFIKIINYVEEKEVKNIEINQIDKYFIAEFFNGNFNEKIVIFAITSQKGNFICFYNVETDKIETKKLMEFDTTGLGHKVFSETGEFFIEFEGEKTNTMNEVYFKIFSLVKKKIWTLFALEQKKIVQKYGKWVTQEILSFLE